MRFACNSNYRWNFSINIVIDHGCQSSCGIRPILLGIVDSYARLPRWVTTPSPIARDLFESTKSRSSTICPPLLQAAAVPGVRALAHTGCNIPNSAVSGGFTSVCARRTARVVHGGPEACLSPERLPRSVSLEDLCSVGNWTRGAERCLIDAIGPSVGRLTVHYLRRFWFKRTTCAAKQRNPERVETEPVWTRMPYICDMAVVSAKGLRELKALKFGRFNIEGFILKMQVEDIDHFIRI